MGVTIGRFIIHLTCPWGDWLIGLEYIPKVELDAIKYKGGMFSLGIFIMRFDYLVNLKKEE